MNGLGSGDNGEWTFLDIIALISFFIGIENLNMNITQEDFQKETERLDKELRIAVSDIHEHLAIQDTKLNIILEYLKQEGDRHDKD